MIRHIPNPNNISPITVICGGCGHELSCYFDGDSRAIVAEPCEQCAPAIKYPRRSVAQDLFPPPAAFPVLPPDPTADDHALYLLEYGNFIQNKLLNAAFGKQEAKSL